VAALPLALVVCLGAGFAAERPLVSWQGETMGSVYTVKIADVRLDAAPLETLKEAIRHRLEEVNRQMSHYRPESELSRFNRAPAGEPFTMSADFARVLQLAFELNLRSGGALDPTVGPVVNLWGFGEASSRRAVPGEAQLQAALARVGCHHLRITEEGRLVKDIAGLQLNLSAVAKGFGVDTMAAAVRAHGFTNFYVSISGEVYASGHNGAGTDWQVGLSAPVDDWRPGDPMLTVIPLSGRAVSTSGDYQKYFVDAQGRRQSHLIDPRTGRPVRHALGSVSVVADTCAWADGLSTTLFVLGPDAGLKFVETLTNAAALFVLRDPDGTFRTVASSRFPREQPGP